MIKIRRKWLSILLTLAMLSTLLLPLAGPAFAATTYGALTTPTVVPPATADLGTITITVDNLGTGTHSVLVSLPTTDWDIVTDQLPQANVSQTTPAGGAVTTDVVYAPFGANELRLDVTAAAVYTDVLITLTLPHVYVPSDASGDIVATLTGLAGQFTSNTVVVGKASSGAVTVSTPDVPSINESGSTGQAFKINMSENAAGAIKKENETMKFTLPNGFTWNTAGATLIRVNDGDNCLAAPAWSISGNGERTLVINRNAACARLKGIFRVAADISVDSSTAKLGDIEVTVGGTSSYSPGTLIIGKYVDFGVTVTAATVKEDIKPGRVAQKLGKLEIKETAADSLLSGRTLSMSLPAGCKWATIPAPTVSGGGVTLTGPVRVGSEGREVKYTVTNTAGGGKATLTWENMTIDMAADFSGDVKVTVAGSAGAAGEAVLGKATAALTATAETPDLKIGVQSQAAGKITIAEGFKEALKNGQNLTLTAPVGVTWAELPTVSVSAGDVEVDTNAIAGKGGRTLTVPIKAQSSVAGTIYISDILFTIDRTVPEGPIQVNIGGDAIDEVNDADVGGALVAADRPYYPATFAFANGLFPQNTTAAEAINGTCITPAPGETKQTAVFKIGDAKYTINGVEQTMDAAAYIENGRTFVPLRYVAYAAGVSADNILYANGKVTVIKGDKVVQLTIGSTTMVINGISITMDVPAVVKSGRTMLPVRWVAQALGCTVVYNETDQTVTVN
ncbi:MAG: copper amine oxidase N-terminal domain-containing protein [Bacillota bacterium]